MDNFQRCLDILEILGKDMGYWGRHIDEFAECFYSLSKDEHSKLREIVPYEDRFALMGQLLDHAHREFSNSSYKEKRRIFFLCFLAIAFDNFELDYRDSLLLVWAFFKDTAIDKDLRTKVWNEVNFLMPSESLSRLEGYD